MWAVVLVFVAMACWVGASLLSLAGSDDRSHIALGSLGSLLAIGSALTVLLGGPASALEFHFWGFPARLEVDALSAAFLLPLHLVAGLGLLYGKDYWPFGTPKGTGRYLRFFYGLLAAAMTLVFTARQGVLFLMGWELMALAAMFLVGTDHERLEVLRGTWVYLICTHTGTLILIAMTVLLAHRVGGFQWTLFQGAPAPLMDGLILTLAILGFGFKAGLVPLHFWLPAAHAGAPSHVSAILSAVMLKTGVYGMLRISSLLPPVPHLGGLVMGLGVITALFGVGCALAQRDYKRLLAYSSVENIGIIFMGVGLGWAGRSLHQPWLTALGFGGAIFHVWNHAAFKSLLFFGAGSVLHATDTRDMEALGGLGSRMPKTAMLLFPAMLAVSALPPFNGFLSEWLLYRGFFASVMNGGSWTAGLALSALALTGGLAALAFAKCFGFIFLGLPRSPEAEHAHDPAAGMRIPMAILAGLCLAMSLGSVLLLPLLDRVLAVLAPGSEALLQTGLRHELGLMAAMALLLLFLGWASFRWLRRRPDLDEVRPPTWDCGYAQPTARMQYTAASFADGWAILVPGVKQRIRRIRQLFPGPSAFQSEFRDAVGDEFFSDRTKRLTERLQGFRRLQHGQLSIYLLYILVTLVAGFLWMLLRPRLLG